MAAVSEVRFSRLDRAIHPWLSSVARAKGADANVLRLAGRIKLTAWIDKDPSLGYKDAPCFRDRKDIRLTLKERSELKLMAAEALIGQGVDLSKGKLGIKLLGEGHDGQYGFKGHINGFQFEGKVIDFNKPLRIVHYWPNCAFDL